MKIEELTPGQNITILINLNDEELKFETTIDDVIPKKRIVLATPIYRDEKIITFRAKNIITDILVTLSDDKPQLFKNVSIQLIRKSDQTVCYQLSTLAESKPYNRRKSFRCFIGISTTVQFGANHSVHDAVIKDISIDGFSFVCSNDITFELDRVVHVLLNDYIDEIAENFSFHLYGIIVRSYALDENRTVYGCKLNNKVIGLDKYITKKERIRIKNTRERNS